MRVLNFVAVNASQGYPAHNYLLVTTCGSFFTTPIAPTVTGPVPAGAQPSNVRNGAAYDAMSTVLENRRLIIRAQAGGFVTKQFGLAR